MGKSVPAAVEARLASPKLTPMMRQYLTVKSQYPGAIILFRMGDFFETFFEDAEECARLLDITLTARSKERDIPMAGVPHHAIEGYLARLIDFGRTVVLVDQVEDPKQAKGLVRREVTRVLSPGTYLDPNAPARTATYLVAIAFEAASKRKKKPSSAFGLAALDLATGEFRATSGGDDDTLLDELARLGMREVLVSSADTERAAVRRIAQELPRVTVTPLDDAAEKDAVLKAHLGAEEATAIARILPKEALVAAGMTLHYATEAQLRPEVPNVRGEASLSHVEVLRPYVPGDALVLDAQATTHLELVRSQGEGARKGSLLFAIDDAATAMGGRLLARWLLYPLNDVDRIRERQDAVASLIAAPTALDRLRETLAGVGDLERLVGRVVMGRANPRDLQLLVQTLGRAPALLADAAEASNATDGQGALGDGAVASAVLANLAVIDPLEDVASDIGAALVEDPPVDLEKAQVFADGYDAELDRHADLSKNGKNKIAALEAKERERTGITSLKVRYNKVFGYYIEVTKSNLALVPEGYIRKQTTVNSERFFTEELKELETAVLNAEGQRVARTIVLFDELVIRVGRQVRRLRALAAALAELDVLSTFAKIAERRSWVRPVVDDGKGIAIVDGRHPVIEQLSLDLGERFVPNDVDIDDEERLVIITGPNMAGKSTIMRQTALIVILAHMGSFVPAKSARIGLVDRVFTRVGASDDLSRGQSTFMVEMNETARILRSATDRSLILLDEIGRGTSTFDGLSIAWAVAEHLHDVVRAKTLFATHYHELTELCRDKPQAVNRHVAVKEWNDEIVFLRKLLPGATNRSYGVQVARLAGLPASIVARARVVLDSLEAQALSAGDRSAVTHLARARQADPAEGQLFLFSAPPSDPAAADGGTVVEREVLDSIRAMSVDDVTPRQALDLLAAWRQRLDSDHESS